MKKTTLPKGEHEEEIEYVKDLLNKGKGIIEVIGLTKFNEDEVIKINNELRGRE
jgi:hypothetical protein